MVDEHGVGNTLHAVAELARTLAGAADAGEAPWRDLADRVDHVAFGLFRQEDAYWPPATASDPGGTHDDTGRAGPFASCRVLTTGILENRAYVLLDTDCDSRPGPCCVECALRDGLWFWEGRDNRGEMWTPWTYEDDETLGYLAWWGEAPPGADMVRVRFESQTHEVPVCNGYYLFVSGSAYREAHPTLVGYRVGETWLHT